MGPAGVALAVLFTCLVTVLGATAAGAHEPVFVTAADPSPATGPLLEDGNHSWAVYGVLPEAGATRGVRSQLTEGQPLVVDLLIPALSPEQDLGAAELPLVSIRWPDGTTRTLESNLRVRFDEPFSRTSYLRIAELREPASQSGIYGLTVTGRAPTRFSLATGTVEGFGGAKRDVEPAPADGIAGWYATPPPAPVPEPASTATPSSTTTASEPRDRGDDAGTSSLPLIIGGVTLVLAMAAGVTVLIVRRRRAPDG
jgi:hypothetical protein